MKLPGAEIERAFQERHPEATLNVVGPIDFDREWMEVVITGPLGGVSFRFASEMLSDPVAVATVASEEYTAAGIG